MIPQFYQDHLKSQLQPAQYLLLTLLVHLLQTIKQAKLEILAASLPLPILFEYPYRGLGNVQRRIC
jgi:hypothetical protein